MTQEHPPSSEGSGLLTTSDALNKYPGNPAPIPSASDFVIAAERVRSNVSNSSKIVGAGTSTDFAVVVDNRGEFAAVDDDVPPFRTVTTARCFVVSLHCLIVSAIKMFVSSWQLLRVPKSADVARSPSYVTPRVRR